MTFKEADLPDVLGAIRDIQAACGDDHRRAVEWTSAFLDLIDRIPLYPGLANSMVREIGATPGAIDRGVLERRWPSLVYPPAAAASAPATARKTGDR